jgi:hypothetical protein
MAVSVGPFSRPAGVERFRVDFHNRSYSVGDLGLEQKLSVNSVFEKPARSAIVCLFWQESVRWKEGNLTWKLIY